MTYQDLLDFLNKNKDEKYASFSKTLSNSDYQVIGVRIPILKDFVKKHYQEIDIDESKLGTYLEIDFLYFTSNLKRKNKIETQLEFIKDNIYKAKSWAITDMITSFLKKCPFELYKEYFLKMYNSKHIYERRFAYVFSLKFYKDKDILFILDYIKENEDYMVMMAEAWVLATIAITYQEEIYQKLVKINDMSLKRKTISKIVESYRITDEYKARVKELR